MVNYVKLVIIDYIQLMSVDATMKLSSREEEMPYIIRSLKEIAKELGITILA